MNSTKYQKLPDETVAEYKERIFNCKYLHNLTWKEVTDILNENLHDFATVNKYKKEYYRLNCLGGLVTKVESEKEISEDTYPVDASYSRHKDEINYVRSMYRRMSRELTLKDIARETAETFALDCPFLEPTDPIVQNSAQVGTLLLSDWHYGLEINNPFNTYNPEIFHERISKLVNKVINEIDNFKLTEINVLNLGDLISGRIHNTIRINNRYDIITQVIRASEYLAEILQILSSKCIVHYFDCYDNHSRIEPNLSDSLDLENLTRIIHWFLAERLKDNTRIQIHDNEFGPDIITFTLFNKFEVAAVHGNHDKQNKTIDNISMITRRPYDLICSAHFHHFSMDEKNMCILVSNPSLMGTDEFAEKLRLTSKPAQTMIISTDDEVCKYVIRLGVE